MSTVVIYCHANSCHLTAMSTVVILLPCQQLSSYCRANSCHLTAMPTVVILLPCQQLSSYCRANSCHLTAVPTVVILLPCQQLSSYCHVNSCAANGHHCSYVTSLLTFLEVVLLMVLSLITVRRTVLFVHAVDYFVRGWSESKGHGGRWIK
jgi:hypothetical protein